MQKPDTEARYRSQIQKPDTEAGYRSQIQKPEIQKIDTEERTETDKNEDGTAVKRMEQSFHDSIVSSFAAVPI